MDSHEGSKSLEWYSKDHTECKEKEEQRIGQAYIDTYKLYITEQEEDWSDMQENEKGIREVKNQIRDCYEQY